MDTYKDKEQYNNDKDVYYGPANNYSPHESLERLDDNQIQMNENDEIDAAIYEKGS